MSELKLTLFLYIYTLLCLDLIFKLEFRRKNINAGRSKGSVSPKQTPSHYQYLLPRATLIHTSSGLCFLSIPLTPTVTP